MTPTEDKQGKRAAQQSSMASQLNRRSDFI